MALNAYVLWVNRAALPGVASAGGSILSFVWRARSRTAWRTSMPPKGMTASAVVVTPLSM